MNTVHFDPWLSLTKMKSQGRGACGKPGMTSGYPGLVNCKICRKAIEQEKTSPLLKAQVQS
jgi:hypothetical protein